MQKIIINAVALVCGLGAGLQAQGPSQLSITPARVIGHLKTQILTAAPNLVEGRELNAPQGIAVDTTTNPPSLYVADTGNNRILVWKDYRAPVGSFADAVVGQRDPLSTLQGGPGTASSIGLRAPSGLAIDARGNLYVVDTSNNRILRFKKPLSQTGDQIQPDIVIGQTNFTSNQPNQGLALPTAKTIALANQNTAATASLLFDGAGNLWFTDALNNRVLRYPASALGDSAGNAPDADLVLGQADLTSVQTVDFGRPESRLLKSAIYIPGGLAFDGAGRLFVGDSSGRVLAFAPPFRTGMNASRFLGVTVNVQGQPPLPNPNQYSVNATDGLFTINNYLFVVDTSLHRIVRFDPFDSWEEETTTRPSPAAKAVFGQNDFLSFRVNRGQKTASESSLASPTRAVVAGSDVYVCDTGNNRVIGLPIALNNLGGAIRLFGQLGYTYNGVNLVEGRELFFNGPQFTLPNNRGNVTLAAGIAFDRTSNPPHLYIADTFNNRVLGFVDARRVKGGDKADLVIGQSDLLQVLINSPNNDPDILNDSGLSRPTGLAVDSNGNLWVADSANGRVLRFPKPFQQAANAAERADLVLGQNGFNNKIQDATRSNMSRPVGLALTSDGSILVSDVALNRVLLFKKPPSGDFTLGQNASTVIGQRDFNTASTATADNRFNAPLNIAVDTDDRLYVCDTGNDRILIYASINAAANDPAAALSISSVTSENDRLFRPQAIAVSPRTGDIWVGDTGASRTVRFAKFDSLVLTPNANYQISTGVPPISLAIDPFDNLLIADLVNRVGFHYPGLVALSAASYLNRPISPGLIAALYPLGVSLGDQTAGATTVPLPTELVDIQVLINDQPVPLYFVSPGQINFLVPMTVPPSGSVSFLVQRKSIGQVLSSGTLDVGPATPGFFTTKQDGTGQIAALNEDNTLNSAANPISRGKVIQLFGTGQGVVDGAPPDGAAPGGAVSTPETPRIIVNSRELAQADILYSGLAPGQVGVWQVNIRIPDTVPPSNSIVVVALYKGVPSNQSTNGRIIQTTIAVK